MPPSRPITRAQALAVMRQHQKRQKAIALGRQALAHGARVNALGARAIQMELAQRQARLKAIQPILNWWRKEPSADGSQSVTGQSGNDQLQDGVSSQLKKIKEAAAIEADRMVKHAPLPDAEAVALAAFIKNAGAKGVSVTVGDIRPSQEGKAVVYIEAISLTSGKSHQVINIDDTLKSIVQTGDKWSFDVQDYTLKTKQWFSPVLKEPVLPSADFLKMVGAERDDFKFRISHAYLGGLERYILELHQSDTTDARLEADVLAMVAKENDALKSKIIQSREGKLDWALSAIEGLATRLSHEGRELKKIRNWYIKNTAIEANAIKELAVSGKIGWLDAEFRAHKIRGDVMKDARQKGTAFGAAYAEYLKKKNRTLIGLQEKYLKQYFNGKSLAEITPKEREELAKIIIEKAGTPDAKVSAQAKLAGNVGRGLWALTFVFAAYQVFEAENKLEEAGRQTSIIGGGLAGGAAGGAAAGFFCGPASPVCVAVGAVIGSILGALGTESLYDELID